MKHSNFSIADYIQISTIYGTLNKQDVKENPN